MLLFCIIAGLGAQSFVNIPMPSGKDKMASVLSFGAAVFGFAVAWCSLTMDYNVNMKEDIPEWHPFVLTFAGLFVSLNFIQWLGAAAMTAARSHDVERPHVKAVGSVVLWECVGPSGGFGKFVLVVLAFSIVANNIPYNYSLGLCAQVLGDWAIKIPRFLWTSTGVLVCVIAAVAGREHFSSTLNSFLLCMGYWATLYALVIFQEL
jgi:purine-cytosine permease-like protein